ncbi:MAG: efflux RND transporter permease subunit [Phycisphaerae bacterium]|nr:efflux RND transporter permease subunit [Phycisphaerae bacterium]
MDLIRWSMNRPVSVTVGVMLVLIFGLLGLSAIPVQLTPTIDRPIVTVTTEWPGRSPEDVVDVITKEQEKRLKNVRNLRTMRSISREGQAEVTLEFYIGADLTRALQEVSDALRQVPAYPDEVDEPVIKTAEGSVESAIAWLIIDLDPERAAATGGAGLDVTTLQDALDREVKPFLERIDGVAEVNIFGGREREVRVLVDASALAQRGLSHGDVVRALRQENRNVSAGTIAEGKRDYRVRVLGRFATAEDVLQSIVAYREGRPVFVRDVAEVEVGHRKQRGFVRTMGHPCLAVAVVRQSGANVISVMADVRARMEEVRREILPRIDPRMGPLLRLRQVYDETDYIRASMGVVVKNLYEGGLISALVLLVFLRSLKSTAIIVLAIPISVVGTFLVMLGMGRTLNVVSLAGLAFSTGVVVDNAIVVLENIHRRRALGDAPLRAVYRGTKEVWGAVLAGTLSHVAVFVPILTVREEAGRIFFDLTLALSVAILISLVVAITVVPAFEAVLARIELARLGKRAGGGGMLGGLGAALRGLGGGVAGFFGGMAEGLGRLILWLITGWRGWTLRPAVIVVMTLASLLGSRWLTPPLDYLPTGNSNLVFGGLLIPPGLSVEQQGEYARQVEDRVGAYMRVRAEDAAQVAALPKIVRPFGDPRPPFEPVALENIFIGSFQGSMFVGATSHDQQVVLPIAALLTGAMNGMPDAYGGAGQASIFGRGVGGGDRIQLQISGVSLERVTEAAKAAFGMAAATFGYGKVQPEPANFNLAQPEWRLRLTDVGRELGLRTEDVGVAVRGLFDGAFAGDFLLDGRNVDLMVMPRDGRLEYKERLPDVPIATPSGRVVPASTLVTVEPSRSPQEISRIEELPSVTVQITPRDGRALEDEMALVRERVIEPLRAQGLIDPSMRVRLEGSAAKLDEVRTALLGRPRTGEDRAGWQSGLIWFAGAVGAAGVAIGLGALARAGSARRARFAVGGAGAVLLGLIFAGAIFSLADNPSLVMARFVWTVLVTYLLLCALFESFLYPFVIMFSVPLGIVGGFAGLRLVHDWTMTIPTINPQQLDVLTMLGFVILIGTVVNNAILLVEQARNFMGHFRIEGETPDTPLGANEAIARSVTSRVRPIFMTTLTTVGGGLPLVIAPGAGSEMYRGLGAVVVGGLLVSTVFTLVLVPLVFSLVLEMAAGLRGAFGYREDLSPGWHESRA